MKLSVALALATGAFALPVFHTPTTLQDRSIATLEHDGVADTHLLQKRVRTIAMNSGLGIGTIVGNALGEQVLTALPKAASYQGLLNTLLALENKATKMGYVQKGHESATENIRHHRGPDEKSPIVRLLENARDAPPGPWGGVGAAIGLPIGKQIGQLLETA